MRTLFLAGAILFGFASQAPAADELLVLFKPAPRVEAMTVRPDLQFVQGGGCGPGTGCGEGETCCKAGGYGVCCSNGCASGEDSGCN